MQLQAIKRPIQAAGKQFAKQGKFPQSAGDIQQKGRIRCMTPKDQAQIAERLATINQELSWNGVQFKVTKSGLYTIIDKIQGDC